MVESTALLKRRGGKTPPRVRIPPSPLIDCASSRSLSRGEAVCSSPLTFGRAVLLRAIPRSRPPRRIPRHGNAARRDGLIARLHGRERVNVPGDGVGALPIDLAQADRPAVPVRATNRTRRRSGRLECVFEVRGGTCVVRPPTAGTARRARDDPGGLGQAGRGDGHRQPTNTPTAKPG